VNVDLVVAADADDAAAHGARLLAEAARTGQQLALAGGSTPRRAYELAAGIEDDWSGAAIWLGDERCVPPDDERSNFKLVETTLLSRLARPPAAHRVPVELGPEGAAAAYDEALESVRLDLVLLGIGPDGHTASLFPDAPTLEVIDRRVVAAEAGFEPFVPRVTLTLAAIAETPHVVFLVAGEDKAEPAARAFARPPSPSTPASLARSRSGTTTAILDRAAAALL
jgi:6-phosphogluconolactonase